MTERNDNHNNNQKIFHAGINAYRNKYVLYEVFLENHSVFVMFDESQPPFIYSLFQSPDYDIALATYSLN